jgi:hypothetical protein
MEAATEKVAVPAEAKTLLGWDSKVISGSGTVSVAGKLVTLAAPFVPETTTRYTSPLSAIEVSPVKESVAAFALAMSVKGPVPESCFCHW